MRIPDWTPDTKPQPDELVAAIRARRGGDLINLDRALLWSEPLARGWNVYLKAVRTELPTSRKLRELAICTVALLTGAEYDWGQRNAVRLDPLPEDNARLAIREGAYPLRKQWLGD